MRRLPLLLLLFCSQIGIKPVQAQPQVVIDFDTPAFKAHQIQMGETHVSVSYEPWEWDQDSASPENLQYQIRHGNQPILNAKVMTSQIGKVWLQDLDNDQTPEVIVETYSGGAHCCTRFLVHRWQGDRWQTVETPYLDGGGGAFIDLDGDAHVEFVSYDNAFLYAFSSYAGSFPPSQILSLGPGEFVEVTRNYPEKLRSHLQEMEAAIVARQGQEYAEINGLLAGYMAQKILLGEEPEGWDVLMANFDPTDEWGLAIYGEQGEVIGNHVDFPTALQSFLVQYEYIEQPQSP